MVDGYLFDTLAKLADQLRNKRTNRPFGGIQVGNVVHTWGKSSQLSVMNSLSSLETSSSYPVTKSGVEPSFAFRGEAWQKCIGNSLIFPSVPAEEHL